MPFLSLRKRYLNPVLEQAIVQWKPRGLKLVDKAGQEFWNSLWRSSDVPRPVDPSDKTLHNWVNRQFHQLFVRLFDRSRTPDMTLLEVGCGKSAWLPYFSKEFAFKISGLDYSPIGCEMARKILLANGAPGDIVEADLFHPPAHLFGGFDVVASFGLVEHFDDTTLCIKALSRFLKPGGLLITSIPNMVGGVGVIQKIVNRPVYDIHKLIDPAKLREAHTNAGLDVLECAYFISSSFGVNNLAGISANTPSYLLRKAVLGILARSSMIMWWIEGIGIKFPTNRLTSPYINCVARKSTSGSDAQ